MDNQLSIEERIVAAIRQITRAVDLQSRRLVEACGLTGPQLATLQAVAKLDHAPPSRVARAVHLSQGTVTGILDRLEQRGLVTRERSTADRRQIILSVTGAGRELLDSAPSLLQDEFRSELARLEEWERLQMLSTLQRIARLMDAGELDASPHLTSGGISTDGRQEAEEG